MRLWAEERRRSQPCVRRCGVNPTLTSASARHASSLVAQTLQAHGARRALAFALLALFVASIPTESIITLPGIGSISRLIGVAATLALLPALVTRDSIRLRAPSLFLLGAIALVFWWVATYFWSIAPTSTLARGFSLGQTVVFVWMIHELARDTPQLVRIMSAYVLGCYVLLGYVFTYSLLDPDRDFRDLGMFNANDVSTSVALAIPMAWCAFQFLQSRKGARSLLGRAHVVLMALFPVVAVAGLVLTASRGGLILTLLALSIVPLTLNRLSWQRRLLLLVVISAAAWAASLALPQAFPDLQQTLQRLSTTSTELSSGTLTGRTNIWSAALTLFEKKPVAGWGAGTFRYAVEPLAGHSVSAHNSFISIAVDTGLIGLALLVLVIALALLAALNSPASLRPFLLVLLATLIVSMMPSNIEWYKFTWLSLALASASGGLHLRADAHQPRAGTTPLEGASVRPRPHA